MENERKTIVIIGGGVGGLSAAAFAGKRGFNAIVLEKNPSVGGLCTGWYRKGRYIDGCIHWLTGTEPNTFLYDMWTKVGAFESSDDIIQLDSWGQFDYKGTIVTFWRDVDRAEKEWIEISPEDKKHIKKFFKMVRDFTKVELPYDIPTELLNFGQLLRVARDTLHVWTSYFPTMKMTCEKFAERFKNEALRWALTHVQPGPGNLYSMLFSYSSVVTGNGGIPVGGSKPMVERMRATVEELGGLVRCNAEVDTVIIEKKKAVGVRLKNGEEIRGDYVISCLDPYYVTTNMLKGYKRPSKLLPSFYKRYAKPQKHPTPSCCVVSYLVEDLPEIVTPFSFECEPFELSGQSVSHLTIRNYAYDRDTYVQDNKTVVSFLIDQYATDFDYWYDLYTNDKKAYRAKKEELAEIVYERTIKKFPAFAGKMECIDVFTPMTLTRYTNTSRGAFMGFMFNHKAAMWTSKGYLPGLKNFLLSGQWMMCPGGVPVAMMQGMFAVQRICKHEKRRYFFVPRRVLRRLKRRELEFKK